MPETKLVVLKPPNCYLVADKLRRQWLQVVYFGIR